MFLIDQYMFDMLLMLVSNSVPVLLLNEICWPKYIVTSATSISLIFILITFISFVDIFVLLLFIFKPACFPWNSSSSIIFVNFSLVLAKIAMSSTNLKLLSFFPLILIPYFFQLIFLKISSNVKLKKTGESGSPNFPPPSLFKNIHPSYMLLFWPLFYYETFLLQFR